MILVFAYISCRTDLKSLKGLRKLDGRIVVLQRATIGELLCGIRDDGRKARNVDVIESFVADIDVVPTGLAIREYAKQKRILQSQGRPIEDFDILIGSSAIATKAIMVTENVNHLERLSSIKIENWVVR